ncbi:MAG: ribosome maturation factor RimM [Faecalibacterium sp.]|jgi:16S rRNA processing protein RimM|nr:ribosome maturation factor RimM [Faecalibacterium sp.]
MIEPYLEAGKIVTTHGVRGEMKLEVYCDDAALLQNAHTLYRTKHGEKPVTVESLRGAGRMAILKLAEAPDMESARALVGTILYFARTDVRLPAGMCFVQDLLGCEVRDAETGKVYGTVKSVDHPGPQDIYTVAAPSGKEYLFPGVPAFLKKSCPEQGYLLVTPIPGLLDDDAASERAPKEE